jgi:nitrous oxidase accessory protein NosD
MRRALALLALLVLAAPAAAQVWGPANFDVKYVNAYAGADLGARINAAIDASPAGGVVYVTTGGTVTTQILIDQSNTTLRCAPGVVLTKGANVHLIDVVAPNVTVEGCEIDGNKAAAFGITANLYLEDEADHFKLLDSNLHSSNGTNIEATGVGGTLSGVTLRGNRLHNSVKTEVFIIRNVADFLIDGNQIYHDSLDRLDNSQGIAVHTQNPADTARNVIVSNNRMKIGGDVTTVGGTCIEAGAFGGGDIYNLAFTSNTCEATGNHADMVSFANQVHVTVANNTYTANGNPSGLPVIEMAEADGFAVTGNVLNLEGVSSGMSIDGASNGTVSGNAFLEFGSDSGEHFAIKFFDGGASAQNVAITGNLFEFPTPVSGINDYAVAVQSSAANTIGNVTIAGNVFYGKGVGSGGAGTVGVRTEENAGTVEHFTISGNHFNDLNHAILVGSNVTDVSVTGNHFDTVLSRLTTNTNNLRVFTIDRGADPFPGSRCADGSLWVDTDTGSDTNCTTATTGAICVCAGGAWIER